ncbi:hypothetical protein BD779DRAFT_106400 [Infundibulicybe gibba]|nr:hypothetical protein BD779DRAFT_106400 [Infundibulicybe gibba]
MSLTCNTTFSPTSANYHVFQRYVPSSLCIERVTSSTQVASIVVLIHDWFLTIDSELTFIWNVRWNLGTLLYFFTRYPAFVDTGVYLYSAIGYSISPPVCDLVMAVSCWMFLFGIGVSEVIMMICVWAMWGRRRKMAIFLTILALAAAVAGVLGFRQHHDSATFISPEDMPPDVPGCQNITTGSGVHNSLVSDFISLTLLESILLFLMLSKAIQHSRSRSSTFVLECFRHGLLYYAVLSVLSIANLIIILRAGHEFGNLLTSIQRTFHAILSARMLLHLRRSVHQTRGGNTINDGSLGGEIMFRAGSKGSMGNASDRGRVSII